MRSAGAALLRLFLSRTSSFAAALFLILLVANLIKIPAFVGPSQFAGTLAVAAPFVIAAIASTPSILSGGGGIDLSIGPLLGFVNVVLIIVLMPNGLAGPATAVPILLALGALAGFVNGLLVAVIRLQPIVATLGMYLVLAGMSLRETPQPIGNAPHWIVRFDGSFGHIPGALILTAIPVAIWLVLRRTPFHKALLAVGGDDRAAFSAGIDVTRVRVAAYTLGGLFAGVAGLALTALVQSADPTLGPQYTLVAIAAVALGGTSLAGGRGGIAGSILGALSIFLIQNLLTALRVSSFYLQIAYGLILVVAVVTNAAVRIATHRRAEQVSVAA
jgi:ribose transport system permease protein